MAKYLVIVESPAKVKTIKKFLGKNYEVMASNGHIRDLPKSQLGFDPSNDYEPKYITIRGKGELLAGLRKEAKKADRIYLATDPDREGEAISWHLTKALKLEGKDVERITFNEITKTAVKNSLKNPRQIDMNLVDAQQARRMLDRMVGYKISPLLWVKIKKGLSAGRVQSVATRMVVDREQEIEQFEPEEYWYVDAQLRAGGKQLQARLISLDGERVTLSDAEQANKAKARVEKGGFVIRSVKRGERRKHPAAPFTTSNLQQEASRKLGFTTAKTMQVAQQLYEGVDIEGRGTLGLISYIRTDSVRLSDEAVAAAREMIAERYGEQFVPEKPNVYKGRKSAQDAHEAIRPTNLELRPEEIKASLTKDQYNLYRLVYLRFVACQMADALYETQQIEIASDSGVVLRSSAERLKFAGFTAVYEEGTDDIPNQDEHGSSLMADVSEGDHAELLSDEATSALDPDATEAILNLLRDLNRKLGLTIVLITHEMAVIKSICNRVAVMENGRVVEEGDVYDIFAHPRAAITRKFVSSASALSKVHKLMEEGSPLVKPDAHEKLVRLTFHRECVGEHVISTISRDFGVDVNIVLANVEVLEDNPLGGVIALLGGREEQVQSALKYLNENHVYTEVIADGSV